MALVLMDVPMEAKILRSGNDLVELTEGEYLQIRRGTLSDPTIVLQEQVPEGKKWMLRVYVSIDEIIA